MTLSRYSALLFLTAILSACSGGSPTILTPNPINTAPAPISTVTAASSPTPTPTQTAAPANTSSLGDITLPASITGIARGATKNVTDAATLSGFAGSRVFGRGSTTSNSGSSNSSVALVSDCKLTVGATNITLEGGGQKITRPLVGDSQNTTRIDGVTDPGPLGIETASFQEAGSSLGIRIETFSGKIATVGGYSINSAGGVTRFTCNDLDGTSAFTDRSLDTFTISPETLSSLSSRAKGSNGVTKITPAVASDLGGASGSANLGLGATGITLVNDCTASIANGVLTVTGNGGAIKRSETLGSAPDDEIVVVTIAGQPTRYDFTSKGLSISVNQFGKIVFARGYDSGSGVCPG